jgi:hypothetical protein
MPQHRALTEILTLDPERDHLRIVYLDTFFEFPFDTTRALEFALFRTFASPSISGLLDQTGEFAQRALKRYDDTDLIVSEIFEHGYDSERGRAAIRRMNQMHGRFTIPNEDSLYVLSTFVFEPIRWNARFGWRRMVEQERLGIFYAWRKMAGFMSIHDVPATYEAFEVFNQQYEREHFRYADSNRRVANATVEMFLGLFVPFLPKPLAHPIVYSLLDDSLIRAFGYPEPGGLLRALVTGGVKLRGRMVSLLPERKKPLLRTTLPRPKSYPRGYAHPDELGVNQEVEAAHKG